jgi:hypothetical protein
MKVFQFILDGDTEMVAANTVHAQLNSNDIGDYSDTDDVSEVPPEKWSDIKIKNNEAEEGEKEEYTLSEMMEDVNEPELICTSID